ncbi:FecR domain-containing protein [Terrimonas pollutisoli]|uniref:FecR domain-containing protein n=1 Tax=Terrimonas pollutisoli TaxID=3034147 RepID=UPI0023EA85DA|nr:FecR domain-containing protein [Terrimonas sp. H1YJ31]
MENFTHDKMDELLVKYLTDEATVPEQKLVEEWISASEANQHYFRHFQMIWEQSRQLAVTTSVDENKAWQKFQRRIKKEEGRKQRQGFGWWKIAASVLIIVTAGLVIRSQWQTETKNPEVLSVVAANEVKKDTLPDGSVATLNKHSVLSYPSSFKGKTRKVKLKGEAFFHVTPDKTKPFIIDVNDVQVKVVGTSFNVRSINGSTEVIVETGVVQVTRNGVMVELRAGEQTSLVNADTSLQKQETEDKLYNYYVSKTFVCDNTPLWKLIEKLNEAYDVNIRIEKESLRKLPLTVTFDQESLDTILDIIGQTLMIKVSKKENEIILH